MLAYPWIADWLLFRAGRRCALSIRNGLMALAALGISACSGGGGVASSGLPQGQPSSSSGTTSQTVTRTYTIASVTGSYGLPPLGGFSGSLTLPAATVPANTSLELTSSLQAPADAPILQDAGRRPQATGTLNVYFYTTIRLSSTVTFPTLPGFSVTLPTTVNPASLQFFYAIANPKPTNGAELQFRTEGPATVSGQSVNFAPSTTPLTIQAGQPYTVAFYAISAIVTKPTPTPPLPGKIYVTEYCDGLLATFTANGVPTTPTITGLNFPHGVAVDAVGKIYVANYGVTTIHDGSVTTYSPGGASAAPTITGLDHPYAIAVDTNGRIYVSSLYSYDGWLNTYNSQGTQTFPTIRNLNYPLGVALDAAGKIYVTNYGQTTYDGSVTTYEPNGAPTAPTIMGLSFPQGVAVDAAGKIYVANGNAVTTYNAAGVQVTPTITAGLSFPQGVAVDAAGKIYVTNSGNGTVTTYAANGTRTTPTITGLCDVSGIAVH
jgi:sugar lactone lactonase YvrE